MRKTFNKEFNVLTHHWDSPWEMAEFADTKLPLYSRVCQASWTGESWDEAIRRAKFGDTTYVSEAEKMLEDIVLHIEAETWEWAADVAGCRPSIPDAIAGMPTSMRRKVYVESEKSLVKIVVDTTSSASIPKECLARRGTAILALAMVISRTRPVELFVMTAGSGEENTYARRHTRRRKYIRPVHDYTKAVHTNVVRVGTSPLDMAIACNALTSVGMARGIGYSLLRESLPTTGIKWAWNIHPTGSDEDTYSRRMKEALGLGARDVFMPPIHLYDPAVQDPEGWVRRTIEKVNKEAEQYG